MSRSAVKIALTGQLGAGKTAAAGVFLRCGIPVLDSDALCHYIAANFPEVREKIVAAFGSCAYLPDGSLNRSYLSKEVFAKNPEKLKILEEIVHPKACELTENFARNPNFLSRQFNESVVKFPSNAEGGTTREDLPRGGSAVSAVNYFASISEVPLLFEKNLDKNFDCTVCVICSDEALRRDRLAKRGVPPEMIDLIDAKQMSASEKRARASYTIDNNSDFENLEKQVRDCVEKIKENARR